MQLEILQQLIKNIHPLTDSQWEEFSSIWKPFSAKRKITLTAAGEVENYLYFVTEGVQRIYYLDEQGREATLVFSYAPSFGGVLDSFMLQQKSKYDYETLTPSVFLRASFTDLQTVIQHHPIVETMILRQISSALSGVLDRLVELQCYSSTEKFKKLLSRSPHILQLIPHKYLANYIGVDPTNFSKFINNVKT